MRYETVKNSADYILERTRHRPSLGIILGSGLGALAGAVEEPEIIPYAEIPGFPQSTVAGHAGNLVLGRIGAQTVAVMQGRFHYYEGLSLREVTYPIYVLRLLGVESLIVTNACGAINRDYQPGDLVLLRDFVNIMGLNPLTGPNDERFGPRFPDMSEPYPAALRRKAKDEAGKMGLDCHEGVYAWFGGPSFETAAEIRMAAVIGADLAGMSTVPETIVANYLGMQVLGIGCVTNMATGIATVRHSHEAVLKTASEAGGQLVRWVKNIVMNWD